MGYAILGFSGEGSSYWTGFLPGLTIVGIGEVRVTGPALAGAYQWVMFFAVVRAGLSALTAGLTMTRRKENPRGQQ